MPREPKVDGRREPAALSVFDQKSSTPGDAAGAVDETSAGPPAPSIHGLASTVQAAGKIDPAEGRRRRPEKEQTARGAGRSPQPSAEARGEPACDEIDETPTELGFSRLLPTQAGFRLSRKLCTPSWPSALARMSAMRRAVSVRSAGVISWPATSRTSCLQAIVAIGPLATMAATISSTLASSASAAPTSWTKPHAFAAAAPKRSAVTKQRRAACSPMARTTYGLIVAGSRPSRASLRQKVAPSTAMRMSHTAAMPRPPA